MSWLKYLLPDEADEVEAKIDHYTRVCFALFTPYIVPPSP